MTKRLGMLAALWVLPALSLAADAAPAASPTAAAGAPSAGSGQAAEDQDIYYAPEESGEISGQMGASQGSVSGEAVEASYLSHAKLEPFAWGRPKEPLDGVELFLNGQYLGKSPVSLDGFMVQRSKLSLTARKDGYEEAERTQVKVPAEGPLRIALVDEGAARYYTTPAWLVGLGLIGASIAIYNNGSNDTAIGLAAGGLAVISVSQLLARLVHLPALRRDAQAYNQHLEAAP